MIPLAALLLVYQRARTMQARPPAKDAMVISWRPPHRSGGRVAHTARGTGDVTYELVLISLSSTALGYLRRTENAHVRETELMPEGAARMLWSALLLGEAR